MMKKKLLLPAVIILALALILMLVMGMLKARRDDLLKSSEADRNKRFRPSITYMGQDYPLKRNMSCVLLIGTDNYVNDNKQIYDDSYYHNYNLADFLVILVFDHSAKTVTPFQIGRDTMCEVTRMNIAGEPLPSRYMQITLSHSYGTGKEDSCINTRNCVENLLFHVPIDNFFAFTMDAVPFINDLVGGVTVTLEHDVPTLGSDFVKGATVTLKGKDALSFVRYRNTDLLDSNLERMSNQRLYLNAFTGAAREAAGKDPDLAVKAFKLIDPYLCTDLTVNDIQKMVDNLVAYEILPFVTPAGKYDFKEGEQFPGFYTDDAAVWACVKPVFCA